MFARERVLTVDVEAVDAELDLGEDATGGVGRAAVAERFYHLRLRVRARAGGGYMGYGARRGACVVVGVGRPSDSEQDIKQNAILIDV